MKNRAAKILGTLIAIVAIAAFDICLRYTQNRLLIATGILLTIAAVLVAFIDEKTRRSRKYDPIDYTVVKGIRVKDYTVPEDKRENGHYPSDHLPIVCNLVVE